MSLTRSLGQRLADLPSQPLAGKAARRVRFVGPMIASRNEDGARDLTARA